MGVRDSRSNVDGRVAGVEGLNDAGLTSLTEVLVLVMMFINTLCIEITKITVVMDNSRGFVCHGEETPSESRRLNCRGVTITFRHTILGRTPLDGRSAQRRDLN